MSTRAPTHAPTKSSARQLPRHASRTTRSRLARRPGWTVLLLLVFVAVAATGLVRITAGEGGRDLVRVETGGWLTRALAASSRQRWTDLLGELDHRRDQAWQRGRPARLDLVFAPGTSAVRSDRAALRGYLRRGYDVGATRISYELVHVVHQGPDRVRLSTIDALRPVVVTDPSGRRQRLPRDRPTHHLITLVHTPPGWRIAAIHTP